MSFIELCAGAGGLSCGLMKAGLIPLLLNDVDKDCCQTLKLNHPNIPVVCDSFENIDFTQYKPDLLCGGVPCQSFSQAGKRKGLEDPRGSLMFKFLNIISKVNPKVFMIENVKGLLTHNKGETIKLIIDEVSKDYNISYKCLDASFFNVPQKRERVFIVGVLKSLNKVFEFPEENKERTTLKDVFTNVPDSLCAKYTQEKIDLFKFIPQGGCWVNLPEELQKKYLGKSFESGGGKRGILHRLNVNKPSLTIMCSPSQKQTERCHPFLERPLSVRESARIQSFEDDYKFVGSMSSQYRQVGNAVPVMLAKAMGESIVKLF